MTSDPTVLWIIFFLFPRCIFPHWSPHPFYHNKKIDEFHSSAANISRRRTCALMLAAARISEARALASDKEKEKVCQGSESNSMLVCGPVDISGTCSGISKPSMLVKLVCDCSTHVES